MFVRVDPSNDEPVFLQIVNAVKRAVATGRLEPDQKLPSVRELARELVINPNTIAKAYRTLEAEGVTVNRRGSGTFVAAHAPTVRPREARRRFTEALEAVLADAVHAGLSAAEARRLFEQALKRFRFEGERK